MEKGIATMDTTNAERRKLFRIEVVTPVRFRMIDEKTSNPLTDWIEGVTDDVSLGGLKIIAPMPESQVEMLVDQYVLFEFSYQLPDSPKAITGTATLAYFLRGAAVSKATVTFGLSFVTIDNSAKDIIGEFIRQHIDTTDMTNAERRKLFRIEVVTPVRFRMIEEKTSKPLTEWMNGSTADVSLGGVKIIAPMPESQVELLIDQYGLIEFSYQLPGAPKAIAGTAAIAFFLHGETKPKASTVTFGLSFVTIDNSVRDVLGEFIRQRIDDECGEQTEL
jgi:c-di-GMP-binding flagellar brake protein YcgR